MSNKKSKEIRKAQRDAYGEALLALMEEDPQVLALTADLCSSTRLEEIKCSLPERFFNLGVAEQNAVGMATGLALEGFIPFLSSFAVFLPGRCFDQIRVSVCQNKANVKLVGSHLGLSNAGDGATAQSVADIALMRALPNMTVFSPADAQQTEQVVKEAAEIDGPVYLRMSRAKTACLPKVKFAPTQVLQKGKKATLVGTGPILARLWPELQKLDLTVINVARIKPLDDKAIMASAKKTAQVITLEEHSIIGGLGDAVSLALSDQSVSLTRLGLEDVFGQSARSPEKLYKEYQLDNASLIKKINKIIS